MVKKDYIYKYIIISVIAIAVVIAIIFGISQINSTSAKEEYKESSLEVSVPITKQSPSKIIDLEEIINNNEDRKTRDRC